MWPRFELTATIQPVFLLFIDGAIALIAFHVPFTLMSRWRSNAVSAVSPIGVCEKTPAEQTRMSIGPRSFSAAATAAFTAACSATLAGSERAFAAAGLIHSHHS